MSRYFPGPDECGRHVIFGCVSLRTYAGDQLQLSLVERLNVFVSLRK